VAKSTDKRRVPAIIVHQWLAEIDNDVGAIANPEKFDQFASQVVDQQPMTDETRTSWRQFLCRHVAPEDSPLFTFSRQSPDVKRTSHFAIISRATLLLPLASGATAKLFRDAGINGQSIEFWWQRLGQGRGLWEGTKEVDDLVDLWADIEAMLASVDAFQGRNDLAKQTFFLLAMNSSRHLLD
jgi:hypothetical protein